MTLLPTLDLSFEMTSCLTDMELAGMKIDSDALDALEVDYKAELVELEVRLNEMTKSVMGDTPINYDSQDDMVQLIYSRRVKDKALWKSTFGIGNHLKGNNKVQTWRPRMTKAAFSREVKTQTEVVKRTRVIRCGACQGSGEFYRKKKDGSDWKKASKCKSCGGAGVIYQPTGKVAGFKLVPRSSQDAAEAGFQTNKKMFEEVLPFLEGDAKEFIEKFLRRSAVTTYLTTFVGGTRRGMDKHGILRTSFNQINTSTGRLSTSRPNFQNMPRGNTFPLRRCIVSRFEGGSITKADYSQLEFRVAGFLAQDKRVYEDVLAGVDVHAYTASVIGCSRQEAKADTFKPLYGGSSGTDNQQAYYRAFKEKYSGVAQWHETLQTQALIDKVVQIPSGREYSFPYTKRTKWGGVTGATRIKNYPVQGFATGDLVPISLVALHRMFKLEGLKSIIINTVHDENVVDTFPGEEHSVARLLRSSMMSIKEECMKRYGVDYDMPIGIEVSRGLNWLETEEVKETP